MANRTFWRGVAKRIPFIDSVFSLANALGVNKIILGLGAPAVSALLAAWSWLRSDFPPWAIPLGFAAALFLVLGVINWLLGIILRAKQLRQIEVVDRVGLAAEAEYLSKQIFALAGEHAGAIQAGFWADSPGPTRNHQYAAVGKLVEKYSERFEGKAWAIIYAATKLGLYDQRFHFFAPSGSQSDHSIREMAQFLARLASDLRYGKSDDPTNQRPF
jgi:hypothetical protein